MVMQSWQRRVAGALVALVGVAFVGSEGVVGTLEAELSRFADADAIPSSSLPATTVPWGLLIAGIVLLVLGGMMILRSGRVAATAAVVVGALLVVVPLVLSLPTKASSADTMNDNLEPVYTREMLDGASGALTVVGAMGTQMQEEMLPALGTQLGMDETQLKGSSERTCRRWRARWPRCPRPWDGSPPRSRPSRRTWPTTTR